MGISAEQLGSEFPDLEGFELMAQSSLKLVLGTRHIRAGPAVLKIRNPRKVNARCNSEALALAAAAGPEVPELIYHGTLNGAGGPCGYSCETRLKGISVQALVEQRPLPELEAVRMARDVLTVMARLETAGLAHRDIKPRNILRDADGSFRLIDYDIAWGAGVTGIDRPDAFARRMTFAYVAPERVGVLQPSADVRQDLYALAVTMHEVLSGRNVFRDGARSDDEVLERAGEVELPSLPRDKVKGPLFDWIRALAAKRPGDRPHSAAEALSRLDIAVA